MQELVWVRPRADSEMQFAARSNSNGRLWTGIEAAIYDASGGRFDRPPMAAHTINMHVGPPVDRSEVLVHSVADEAGLNRDILGIPPQLQLRDRKLQHLAWALKEELETQDGFDRAYGDGIGVALAVQLLRRYSRSANASRRGLTEWQLENVLRFIDENLDKNLSLAELARETCVSVSYFKVLFKESMGLPVHKYIIKRRVEYASMLVTNGTSSLSQIAIQAGFCDQGHMARCMRRLTGIAPSELPRLSQ